MLLAPVLAVALVLSIATAVSFLPAEPQTSTDNKLLPKSLPIPYFPPAPSSSAGAYTAQTPVPSTLTPAATPYPTAAPMATTSSINLFPFIAAAAAIVIGIIAAVTLFSERSLKKDLENN